MSYDTFYDFFRSRHDIESNMDVDGNVRLIEFYSSEDECELEFGNEGRPFVRRDSGSQTAIGRTFSERTSSPSVEESTEGKRGKTLY